MDKISWGKIDWIYYGAMRKIIQSGSLRLKYMAEELEIDTLEGHYSFYNWGMTYEQNVLIS